MSKARSEDEGRAGDHVHPEIGGIERDLLDSLMGGERDAMSALRDLVDELWESGREWQGVDPWVLGEPIEEWKQKALMQLATHPMRAFLLGQMLATEHIGNATMQSIHPEDRRAIEMLEHTTFSEIDDSFERLKGELRQQLIAGMQERVNPREVARRIASSLHDWRTNWDLIAITETARAESQGRLIEYLDQGLTAVQGSSAHDPRTCPWCLENVDGKFFTITDIVGRSNYGRRKADWIPGVLPAHPACRCAYLPA